MNVHHPKNPDSRMFLKMLLSHPQIFLNGNPPAGLTIDRIRQMSKSVGALVGFQHSKELMSRITS